MNYKIIHLGGKVLRVDTSVPDYIQTIDQDGNLLKVEGENGDIIYVSKDYQELELLETYSKELKKYPTKWVKAHGSKYTLTRYNFRLSRENVFQHYAPQFFSEYKCEECDEVRSQNHLIKAHLRQKHNLYQREPAPPPKCHACGYKYKVGLKHHGYPGIAEAREKHFPKCKATVERLDIYTPKAGFNEYAPKGGYIEYEEEFDTTKLEFYDRMLIDEAFNRSYISQKHIIAECQAQYIDKYTTAYGSEVVKRIMEHNE